MTLQYASDLHLEFPANRAWLKEHPIQPVGDILVLAGDILLLGDRKLEHHEIVSRWADQFEEVYLIPGNHEYYRGLELRDTLTDFEYPIHRNVRFLNNRSIRLGETDLFFTSLWSVVDKESVGIVNQRLNDCHHIHYKSCLLAASRLAEIHSICLEWLSEALTRSDAPHKVVVTHHCPTRQSAFNNHPGSLLNSAFMVDLDQFIESHEIDYWIYGHTHYNGGCGTSIAGTKLLTNQLGYVHVDELWHFKADAILPFQ